MVLVTLAAFGALAVSFLPKSGGPAQAART
jgi:hypothetical protein